MIFFIFFASLFANPAQSAGLLVEPRVGYERGSFQSPQSDAGTASGVGFGARSGLEVGPLFLALDFHFGSLSAEINGVTSTKTVESLMIGPHVGLDLIGTPFRVWAGYYFLNHSTVPIDPEVFNANFSPTFEGSAFRLGAGYSLIRVISINLDYTRQTFTSVSGLGLTTDLDEVIVNNQIMLSLSVPLSFAL